MRIVVARRTGRRGEGLGNEILPWAKGWLASQVLGAHLVGPSWGLNKRRYYRNFGTSRLDVLLEDILARLPHHAFTAADYYASGESSFDEAVRKYALAYGLLDKPSFVLTVDGMYGGYHAIRNARPFLLSQLLTSRDALRNAYRVASQLDRTRLFIAVHMRFGADFQSQSDNPQGRFNFLIPAEWYLSACQALRDELGDLVQFHFFTDRGGPAFDEAVRRFNPGQTRQPGLTECSDLILMSQADLLICSLSSYSLTAAFLSGGLYLWYETQLTREQGQFTLWGMEEMQRQPNSPTRLSMEKMAGLPGAASAWNSAFKGYAYSAGSPLPPGLLEQLRRRSLANDRSASLLEYGSLPEWTLKPGP